MEGVEGVEGGYAIYNIYVKKAQGRARARILKSSLRLHSFLTYIYYFIYHI